MTSALSLVIGFKLHVFIIQVFVPDHFCGHFFAELPEDTTIVFSYVSDRSTGLTEREFAKQCNHVSEVVETLGW